VSPSTARFDYGLPPERIAQHPADPRDASRLLDARDMADHRFTELPALLTPGDLVVVNHTRVRPARLHGIKSGTGGGVEMLLLRRLEDPRWEAMVRPARRVRAGMRLEFGPITAEVVTNPVEGVVEVAVQADIDVEDAIEAAGEVPLPPYITTPLADPDRYQTMFAERPGSSAAPTAGLHFTPAVVDGLGRNGVDLASVELDVGLATFRPITTEHVEDHVMHRERCRVPPAAADAIARCRARSGRVVAVGTTVVRTLETFRLPGGLVEPGECETELYLTPGSDIGVVDLLVTNFHLPRSSLLVLVEAFMGAGWREVYAAALERGYRFLSFGDVMLCAGDR
jgi:S-adenosylmethionine:tRNA ribosyltransferase-isomerase